MGLFMPLLAMFLVLTGCTTALPRVHDLKTVTLADVRAAAVYATEHGDQAGMACYPVLEQHLKTHRDTIATPVVGIVSAFEMARVSVRQPTKDDTLQIACAALLLQTVHDVLKIEAQIAGLVGSGGLSAGSVIPQILDLLRVLGVSLP